MKKDKNQHEKGRRGFLKTGLLAGGALAIGSGLKNVLGHRDSSGEKTKVLTQDGELLEVDSHALRQMEGSDVATNDESRQGITGKKFVMVIDLSRCKNARKCQKACQKMHSLDEHEQFLRVYKMQDAEATAPYWMPKPCLHCDKPPCVKVCPVDATFKRDDGIVLIDNERCIGCRFCMAACPYSSRTFNWSEPKNPETDRDYSPETGVPRKLGTVEKCDFCPDMLRKGLLPNCVTACPNGVFYFGDKNEDSVTNGDETVRFSELIRDKAGYRYLEELGTDPSVYYLPAANRIFPFKEEEESKSEEG